MRRHLQPDQLHIRRVDGHVLYSHVVVTDAPTTIYVAGQTPRDPDGNTVGKGDMRAQILQVVANLKAALAAAGATLDDVVKTTTYVTDVEEFFRHSDVRTSIFGPTPPTSTTIEVKRLANPDFLVEIEAIAVKDA